MVGLLRFTEGFDGVRSVFLAGTGPDVEQDWLETRNAKFSCQEHDVSSRKAVACVWA